MQRPIGIETSQRNVECRNDDEYDPVVSVFQQRERVQAQARVPGELPGEPERLLRRDKTGAKADQKGCGESRNSGRNSGFLKVFLLRESLDITAQLWTREERVDS